MKTRMVRRPLSAAEIKEARAVFGDSISYKKVRIMENAAWPDYVARISARLRGSVPPEHSAIALGYWLSFPVTLKTLGTESTPESIRHLAWLVHELAHVWQYEHYGVRTLFRSLRAHVRYGMRAYDYGGEAGLEAHARQGGRLSDLNPEQQGDLARDYYQRWKRGADTSAWEPFMEEFKIGEGGPGS
jgi:hypothetical protein